VTCVNWNDATAFVQWLAKTSGQPYRLLSEAEWEYAARGVTSATSPHPNYHFGDREADLCKYANGADETAKSKFAGWTVAPCADGHVFTAPVGSKEPNAFGLRDVLGNVWEWVEDVWHDSYQGAPTDGSSRTAGGDQSRHVLRGGSWFSTPQFLRSANRGSNHSGNRSGLSGGFRVARVISR